MTTETIVLDLSQHTPAQLEQAFDRMDAALNAETLANGRVNDLAATLLAAGAMNGASKPELTTADLAGLARDLSTHYAGGDDGPIREPGDDMPSASDVLTPDEMIAALHTHSALCAKRGLYGVATDCDLAADTIDQLMAQIEQARVTIARLVGEIAARDEKVAEITATARELRFALTGVSEPGDAERIRRARDEVEADRGSDDE